MGDPWGIRRFHKLTVDMTKEYRYPNILQSIWILILFHILQLVLFRLRRILGRVIFSLDVPWRVMSFLFLFYDAVSLLIPVVAIGLILMVGLNEPIPHSEKYVRSCRSDCPYFSPWLSQSSVFLFCSLK